MSETKKYQIIYADPPWSYQDQGCQGTMANHYKGMRLEDIKALPVKDITSEDAVLFLWTTYPMLKEALEVISAWGFKYKTIAFQWVKLNKKNGKYFFGLGRWTRGNTEPCLLATKGSPKRISSSVFQIITSPLRKHSQKPDETRQRIVSLLGEGVNKIELFARQKTPGWDCIGNEVSGKDIKQELAELIN